MKKGFVFVFSLALLFLFIILINLVHAQMQPPFPGDPTTVSNIPVVGNIDPNTGLPQALAQFQAQADQYQKEESKTAYLKREWTKLFAGNSFFGPIFFYGDKFFSFFNPIWKLTFGMEFTFSWAFFTALGVWIVLIIIIYTPVKDFTNFNHILTLLFSAIVASLIGVSKVISMTVDALSFAVNNIWILALSYLIVFFLVILYVKVLNMYGKAAKKKAKDEEISRAEQNTKSFGRVSEKGLKELGED